MTALIGTGRVPQGCRQRVAIAALRASLRPGYARPRIRLRCEAVASSIAMGAAHHEGRDQATNPPNPLRQFLEWWKVDSPSKQSKDQSEGSTKLGPVLKKLWSLCVPDIWLLITASCFMATACLVELGIPHYATKSIFAAAEGSTSFQGYLGLLTAMVLTYGIAAAFRGFCFSILNNRMTRRLRTELFMSLAKRETSFFDGEDVGNMTSRLQADCQAMTKVIATNANIAVRNFVQAVGGIMYLYYLSPSLCGLTVGISGTLWAVTLVYGQFARRMQKIFQDVLAESNTVAEEALTMSRVVRTFGTEGAETKRYTSWLDRLYQVAKRQAAGYSLFIAAGHIACYASKVAALAVGCSMVLTGKLTAEQLTNFIFYVEFVTYASLNVCDEFTEICEAVGASERVVTMLHAPPAPQIAPGNTLPSFSGRITLRDVRFSYPSRPHVVALDGVSLTLQPGKLTALVGLSGSGKSTVCSLLQRLYDPAAGAVMLDDTLDLRQADAAWYRTQIGVVPQEPRLFSGTIAHNIAYGMEHEPPSREAVEVAAREANAHGFISALPQGYDTPVTDKLLSGGQKQRLALARALIRKPKLLVLDEFSSALDAESEAQVHAALEAAMSSRERTVVVIAHRLSTVRNADCIVVMDKGQVREQGSHHELLGQRGIYWQLVCRQQYGIDPTTAAGSAVETDSDSILAAAAAAAAAAGELSGSSDGNGTYGYGATSVSAAWNGGGSPLSVAAQVSAAAAAGVTMSPSDTWGEEEDFEGGELDQASALASDVFLPGDMTDDAHAGGLEDASNGLINGDYDGVNVRVSGTTSVSGSMTGSMATIDVDDGEVDEAGRLEGPTGSGKMMAAVLAGVVVSAAEVAAERAATEAAAMGLLEPLP